MKYQDLSKRVRRIMHNEAVSDRNSGLIEHYYGVRLLPEYHDLFYNELIRAINEYDNNYLANMLPKECFHTYESKNGKMCRVPYNANELLSQHVFHIYYLRAVCIIALEDGVTIEWYRAKASKQERQSTNARIGTTADPVEMLANLRQERPSLPELFSGGSLRLIKNVA